MSEKLYFLNEDANLCYPLDYFLSDAKEDGLKEIELMEAIPDKRKDFIWCTNFVEVVEANLCKKAECSYYQSRSGRGVCSYRGSLYTHGDKVKFDVI